MLGNSNKLFSYVHTAELSCAVVTCNVNMKMLNKYRLGQRLTEKERKKGRKMEEE